MSAPTTRRAVLATAAGFAAGVSLPAALAAPAPTRIEALFREWYRLYVETEPVSDEHCNELCDEAREIEAEIMALPSVTARDLAMKVIVETGNSQFEVRAAWLDAQVYPLAGVTVPA